MLSIAGQSRKQMCEGTPLGCVKHMVSAWDVHESVSERPVYRLGTGYPSQLVTFLHAQVISLPCARCA